MRFSIITISFFLMILLVTHSLLVVAQCPKPVPEKYLNLKPGNVVAAYFGGWEKAHIYKVEDIEPVAHLLTHVIYAFAKPNAQTGTCELADPWSDVGANFEHRKKVGGNFGKLLELKKKYPHLKVLLSVGGGKDSKAFAQIAKKGLIVNFVASTINLLQRYKYDYNHTKHSQPRSHTFDYVGLFDGIDIDWEWNLNDLLPENIQLYHVLMKSFAKYIKANSSNIILTSAVQVHPSIVRKLQLNKIASSVNWFNIMTYDYGGPTGPEVTFNAPMYNPHPYLSVDNSINVFMEQGVALEKMVLGIPLYGHVYDKAQPKIRSLFKKTEKTKTLSYRSIKNKYIDNSECETKWHDLSKVSYTYCPADQIFVTHDNEESVAYKAEYARFKKLKGIFFWRLAGDDANHSLIKSIVA